MKFTLKWLQQFFETKIESQKIYELLLKLGFEVKDFKKTEDSFVVAEILSAKKHPDADKLKVCIVRDEKEELQIVCGAENARAGIKVVLAKIGAIMPIDKMKIKETNIRGVQSFGMMCSAKELGIFEGQDGKDGIIELGNSYKVGKNFEVDTAIEIEVTPNRGDALCVYGIARELAAVGFGKLKSFDCPKVEQEEPLADFSVCIKNQEACQKFIGALIKGVNCKESPSWILEHLHAIGVKPVCAPVDIANYVMFTFGTPMHVYDAEKIEGNKLQINYQQKEESFTALDGKKYIVPEKAITISDKKNLQCIAGIIGARRSECTDLTKDIFLECASFNHVDIAIAKRRLDVNTDSSYRFERQIDNGFLESSLKIATKMILDICGGKCHKIISIPDKNQEKELIEFDPGLFYKVTGIQVSEARMMEILKSLGFGIECVDNFWKVSIPTYRNDINTQNCIVEEILRIVGYDKLKNNCFRNSFFVAHKQTTEEKIRSLILAKGFSEVITWSFMDSAKNLEPCGGIEIENPVTKKLNIMRQTLAYNLLDAALENSKNGAESVKIFELGKIYKEVRENKESNVISGLRFGNSFERNLYGSYKMDFFDVKSDVLSLLEAVNAKNISLMPENNECFLHPKRSARIMQNDKVIGYLGALHPNVTNCRECREAFFFEIFVDKIKADTQNQEITPSKYPVVSRDFAFIFKNQVQIAQIEDTIKSCSSLIKDISLFDSYKDDSFSKHAVSLAFAVKICSHKNTLKSEEIDKISENIIFKVEKTFGAILRKDYQV